ncbi:hypothetical protein ACC810_02920 [Rhizobium ruizarguesonis]
MIADARKGTIDEDSDNNRTGTEEAKAHSADAFSARRATIFSGIMDLGSAVDRFNRRLASEVLFLASELIDRPRNVPATDVQYPEHVARAADVDAQRPSAEAQLVNGLRDLAATLDQATDNLGRPRTEK